MFLSSPADIAIFGGAAGGGKSYALLMDPIRYFANGQFGAVIFRRLSTQITGEGGLWDTVRALYPHCGGKQFLHPRHGYRMPSGSKVTFAHLQYEKDVEDWQGSQIPYIGFDELTHFSEYQFFYMLSRNRSACGVRPCVRATCNPDVDSWVAKFIDWWIDPNTGYPIQERSGQLRYFTRINGVIVWGDSKEEVAIQAGIPLGEAEYAVKSVTFIPSKLEDNQILMERDPTYKANLMALPRVERLRLLGGNWKVRRAAGDTFPATKINYLEVLPTEKLRWVRRWDLAGTEPSESNPDPDATASVLMAIDSHKRVIIADGINERIDASKVKQLVKRTAESDRMRFGLHVHTMISQDPGQAGKDQAQEYVKLLMGHRVSALRETGSKLVRAHGLSSQWFAGNVYVLRGPWNEKFSSEMDAFPYGDHDDYADAATGAFNTLMSKIPSVDRFRGLAS